MAKAEHTPGPYEFSSDGIWGTSPWNARVKLATVTRFAKMNGIDSDANGALFATAPDLLEAVQELLATHPAAYRKPNAIDNRTDNAVRIARAAIAKAEGRS